MTEGTTVTIEPLQSDVTPSVEADEAERARIAADQAQLIAGGLAAAALQDAAAKIETFQSRITECEARMTAMELTVTDLSSFQLTCLEQLSNLQAQLSTLLQSALPPTPEPEPQPEPVAVAVLPVQEPENQPPAAPRRIRI